MGVWSGPSAAAVTRLGERHMLATDLAKGKGLRKGEQVLGECKLRRVRGVCRAWGRAGSRVWGKEGIWGMEEDTRD